MGNVERVKSMEDISVYIDDEIENGINLEVYSEKGKLVIPLLELFEDTFAPPMLGQNLFPAHVHYFEELKEKMKSFTDHVDLCISRAKGENTEVRVFKTE